MLEKNRIPALPPNAIDGEWMGRKARLATNRIVVKLKPIAHDSDRALDDAIEAIRSVIPGGRLLRRPRATARLLYFVTPGTDVHALAKQLSARPDVAWAEPDVIDHVAVVPSDPRYSDQWGLDKVGAPDAWDLATGTSTGTLIGIIDSGIAMSTADVLDHPDLNDSARYILGTDYVDGGTPRDLHGHGTHVAGIAAAETDNAQGVAGMSWSNRVYVCRTLDATGNGSGANFADAVEEIVDYAVSQGTKVVINYSGGGGASMTKQDACQYANDHGMLLCAAAGNDYGGAVIFPAAYSTMFDAVIAVGSTNSDDTVSDFSNVGPEVTVVAPGRDILSTTPPYAVGLGTALNYDYLSGTSMATPLVTGLCALMWSRHPGFTHTKIRTGLISTAVKLGAGTFDNSWGNGRVDAHQAVRYGDLITPTTFTRFTRFTRFTSLTRFTTFSPFTTFTRFTRFTPLTRFTRFTRFVPFTRFPPFSPGPGPDPGPWRDPAPFVRFRGTLFPSEDLSIGRFDEFAGVAGALAEGGYERLDQLATADAQELSHHLGAPIDLARSLVEVAQARLRTLPH
ncbi:MAG: S8 family serine peptidase [Byssovorax sp.]